MCVVNYRSATPLSYGGRTPVGAYNADGFETPTNDFNMSDEQIMRIRSVMEAFNKRRQEAQQASPSSSSARNDLDEANRQSLPVGVMGEEFEDMPPLINLEEGEEEEEDFEDDPELIRASDDETTKAPQIPRKLLVT